MTASLKAVGPNCHSTSTLLYITTEIKHMNPGLNTTANTEKTEKYSLDERWLCICVSISQNRGRWLHLCTHSSSKCWDVDTVGKRQKEPSGWSKNETTYKSPVSSISLIPMQTEQMCCCVHFHEYLYAISADDAGWKKGCKRKDTKQEREENIWCCTVGASMRRQLVSGRQGDLSPSQPPHSGFCWEKNT